MENDNKQEAAAKRAQEIEVAKATLAFYGYAVESLWCTDDVTSRMHEAGLTISEEEALEIVEEKITDDQATARINDEIDDELCDRYPAYKKHLFQHLDEESE